MPISYYALSCDSFKNNICTGFSRLQEQQEFVDLTLAADGHLVKVHKNIVALASPYLKEMLKSVPSQHPVIFLNNVSHKVLSYILEYIYQGEVSVPEHTIDRFMQASKALHINGIENLAPSLINDKNDDTHETLTSLNNVIPTTSTGINNFIPTTNTVIKNFIPTTNTGINNIIPNTNMGMNNDIPNTNTGINDVIPTTDTEIYNVIPLADNVIPSEVTETNNVIPPTASQDNNVIPPTITGIGNDDISLSLAGSHVFITPQVTNSSNVIATTENQDNSVIPPEISHISNVTEPKVKIISDVILPTKIMIKNYSMQKPSIPADPPPSERPSNVVAHITINSTHSLEVEQYPENIQCLGIDNVSQAHGNNENQQNLGNMASLPDDLADINCEEDHKIQNTENGSMDVDCSTQNQLDNNSGPQPELSKELHSNIQFSQEDVNALKVLLQFTMTQRGALQIIVNRYMYTCHHSAHRGRRRTWRCIDYRKLNCRAAIESDNSVITKRRGLHRHPYHDDKIYKKHKKGKIYSSIKQAEEARDLPQTSDRYDLESAIRFNVIDGKSNEYMYSSDDD